MEKKYVAFLAPVYNVNLYLDDFFSSFKNLPKDQYEIIIVNDKSKEDPLPIIKKWSKVVNIKYVENEKNLGIGFSRNVALRNISKKATHFMFVDSDDRLAQTAWDQILLAKNNLVYVSAKYVLFDRESKRIRKTWSNEAFVGAGVLSAWGNLVPVEKAKIEFTSKTFEDFRWMAEITKDGKYEFFTDVIVEYRNRASSIMNTPYNTKRRAKYIVDHAFELRKSWEDKLISDKNILLKDLKGLYINFHYVSSKNREDLEFNTDGFSKFDLVEVKLITGIQKTIRFWWWVETFTKRKAFN